MIKEDHRVYISRASATASESTGTSWSEGVEESGTTEESEPRPIELRQAQHVGEDSDIVAGGRAGLGVNFFHLIFNCKNQGPRCVVPAVFAVLYKSFRELRGLAGVSEAVWVRAGFELVCPRRN
jgi:hypothetical protein